MKLSRFLHLAEAHGGDLDRWPADERNAACALLDTSAEAQAALAEARRLDAWLSLATLPPDAAQPDRIMASLSARIDRESGWLDAAPEPAVARHRWWQAAAFLATMAVMGVIAGDLQSSRYVPEPVHPGIAGLLDSTSYLTAWNR